MQLFFYLKFSRNETFIKYCNCKITTKMKQRILSTVLAVLFLIGFVSAANFAVSPTSVTFTPVTNNTQITVSNLNSSTLLNVIVPAQIQLAGESGYNALFKVEGTTNNINSSLPQVLKITPVSTIDFSKFNLEKQYSTIFNISDGTNLIPVTIVAQNSFCIAGERGDLNLDVNINNKGDFGSEDEWYSLEDIEVEVNVENRASDDIDDIIISWGLYNKRTGEFVVSDDEKRFNLRDGADKTVTFTFNVDPADLNAGDNEDDFVFFVKAYSDDLGEANQCDFSKTSITVLKDDNFVSLGEISAPTTAQCGETISLRATAWNIGDDDEQDVYAIIYNKILGLNKRIDIGDLDMLEDKRISTDFDIPRNLTESTQTIEFKVYNEDDDLFETDDGTEAVFKRAVKISGNCEVPKSADLNIDTNTDEIISAGKEFSVTVTLRNTGSSETTYQILANGYNSWASLKSIDPRSVTLKAGETKDIIITLLPNNDAEGNKDLIVQALYSNLITEQRITIPIEPKQGFSLTGLSIGNVVGGNWFIWAVAALNIILVVLIVIIAVRIAKK